MHLEELWNRQPNNCWCEQHLQGTPVFPLQFMTHLHGKDSAWFWNRVSCRLWGFSEHLTSVNIVSWARPGFFYWRLPPPPSPFSFFSVSHSLSVQACLSSFISARGLVAGFPGFASHTCRNSINLVEAFKCLSHPVSISEVVVQRQCTNPWHDRPAIQSYTY